MNDFKNEYKVLVLRLWKPISMILIYKCYYQDKDEDVKYQMSKRFEFGIDYGVEGFTKMDSCTYHAG